MPSSALPDHVANTVEVLADVQRQHQRDATSLDRVAQALTSALGRSISVAALVIGVGTWLAVNLYLDQTHEAFDPPPFATLELAATLAALFLAALILATQRREDLLAEKRAQLTLQTALLNEQKSSKLIALLEELRRDLPAVLDRNDEEATAMVDGPDAQAVLAAIDDDDTSR